MSTGMIRCTVLIIALNCFAAAANAGSNATPDALHRGQVLHADKCANCHAEKSGLGDGNVLYLRSDRKVKNPKQLDGMVARCNSELRLDLFPEDEADIAFFLSKSFYKFK
ncbi:MAG: hypothetical protein KBA96_10780 [Rhodocyclaceae bacterium]|nr:hypothetical protein [Rhodocyclaceae bacterium]